MCRTGNTAVAGFEVGSEVALAGPGVDQRADADVARRPARAPVVEQRRHVVRTADVERAADAPAHTHPAVQSRRHQDDSSDVIKTRMTSSG